MTRRTVSILLALTLTTASVSAALAQEPASPQAQDLGRLMTQTAKRGTLKPVKGKPRFALELRGVAPQVVWFDDRPGRESGQIPVGSFVKSWVGYGFDAVPPNAALTLLDAADDQDTVVLKLGNPRYKKKTRTIRYSAHILDEATGNLGHLEPQRDEGVPRRFSAASLFIDDGGYGLPTGCQPGTPYIKCTYTSSTGIPLDSLVSDVNKVIGPDTQIDSSTPVWMQAWGGRGAKGGDSGSALYNGAYGGYAGYGIAVSTVGLLGGETLFLYVGASGSKHANSGGQGGASTIVSTQLLSQIDPSLDGLQVVAGGSGGGAWGCSSGRGGDGGVALGVNMIDSIRVGMKGPGQNGKGSSVGVGGNAGNGGAAGTSKDGAGTDDLGGYGGHGKLSGAVGWINVNAVDPAAAGWSTGAGGGGRDGGGGGYGGGGAGGSCGGGGGGGSWAHSLITREDGYTYLDQAAPEDSKQADGAQSKVVLTFHLLG